MPKLFYRGALSAILVLGVGHLGDASNAVEVSVMAPVTCNRPDDAPSCGRTISIEEALASRHGNGVITPDVRLRLTSSSICPVENYIWIKPEEFRSKIDSSGDDLIKPELLPHQIDSSREIERFLGFARSGEAFMDESLQLALHSRRKNWSGLAQIVGDTNSPAGEQRLALCSVWTRLGPPSRCETVALLKDGEIWLRSEDPHCVRGSFALMTSIRASGNIRITFTVNTDESTELFADSVFNLLSKRQGILGEIRKFGDELPMIQIRSSAPIRDSLVLDRGWREAFDFDVIINSMPGNKVVFDAGVNVLVSRTASGNLTEYSGVNDAQRAAYSAYFDALLFDSIAAACRSVRRVDAEKVICRR